MPKQRILCRTFHHRWLWCALLITFLLVFYWQSSLFFFPIPWSDDSVFTLAGAELFSPPFQFRMHSQSMAMPTYDLANFNNMPLLPIYLGFWQKLGVQSLHAQRFHGLLIFGIWCLLLGIWARRRCEDSSWIWIVALAAVTSPILRWGGMAIHTEIWEALFWLLLLMEFDSCFGPTSLWRLSLVLALAAGFHFEGIVWALPVALGVFPFQSSAKCSVRIMAWCRSLVGIAGRTLLFLSPWLVYVCLHWKLFWIQMNEQFHRLDQAHHPFVNSAHSFFHSLFMKTGLPLDFPKFYNAGKIFFWVLFIWAFLRVLNQIFKHPEGRSVLVVSLIGVLTTFWLWCHKPETWFVILIHAAVLPLWVVAWKGKPAFLFRSFMVGLIAIQVAVTIFQWQKTRSQYRLSTYEAFTDCVAQTIGDRRQIWLPTSFDVLVDLERKLPSRDYYGHNCFDRHEDRVAQFMKKIDVVIQTLALPMDDPNIGTAYAGPMRSYDIQKFESYPWIQYKKYHASRVGAPWESKVCQLGPFWATVSLKAASLNAR